MYLGTRREICLFVIMFGLTLSSGVAFGFWAHHDPVIPDPPRVPDINTFIIAVWTNSSSYSELWYSGGAGMLSALSDTIGGRTRGKDRIYFLQEAAQ